jgi:hypothetical protein
MEEFVTLSFSPLMSKCTDLLSSEKAEKFDDLRLMNMMSWVLEFHVLSFNAKKTAAAKEGTTPEIVDASSVQSAINLPAIDLVRKTLEHCGSAKEKLRGESKNFWTLIIAFRALSCQLKMTQIIIDSPDDETSKIGDVIGQNVVYQKSVQETIYLLTTFKSRMHDPRLLTYSIEVSHRIARLLKVLAERGTDIKVGTKRTQVKKKGKADEEVKEILVNESMSQDIFVESLISASNGLRVIPNLMFLFERFGTNGAQLNYMLGSVLHQIVKKEDWYIGHFFQLPYLCEMLKVLDAARARPDAANFRDLTAFARCVVKRFFSCARGHGDKIKASPFLFVEALVPKMRGKLSVEDEIRGVMSNFNTLECEALFEAMAEGGKTYFDLISQRTNSKQARKWSEDEDTKLKENWDQYKDLPNRIEFLRSILQDPTLRENQQRSAKEVMERVKFLCLIKAKAHIDPTDKAELIPKNWAWYLGKTKEKRDVLDYLSAAYVDEARELRPGPECLCPSDVEEGLGDESEEELADEGFEGFGDFADLYADEEAEPPAKRPRVAGDDGLLDDLLAEGDEGGVLDDLLAEEDDGLLDELLAEEYGDPAEGLLDDLLREEWAGDGVLDELLREEAPAPPASQDYDLEDLMEC